MNLVTLLREHWSFGTEAATCRPNTAFRVSALIPWMQKPQTGMTYEVRREGKQTPSVPTCSSPVQEQQVGTLPSAHLLEHALSSEATAHWAGLLALASVLMPAM